MTAWTGQINMNLLEWQQQAREEAIKEVAPDTLSACQAVNVASDDDEGDQEENIPGNLTAS